VEGGIQLGPLGTKATNRPTMAAPGDYDDGENGGMMIGRGNRSTRRKPAPVPLSPPQSLHFANSGRRCGKPATKSLSYGTALSSKVTSYRMGFDSRQEDFIFHYVDTIFLI
jgi:hypothetical protein